MRDPEFRHLLFTVLVLLLFGTLMFSYLEGWSLLDSLYFSLISLTTIGYGDFTPQTAMGKLWTMLYIISGIGVISTFVAQLVTKRRQLQQDKPVYAQEEMQQAQDALNALSAALKDSRNPAVNELLKNLQNAQANLQTVLAKLPAGQKSDS